MQTYETTRQAADLLGAHFWGFYDRVDRIFLPRVKCDRRGRITLVARGCTLIVPQGAGLTPERLVALFVVQHAGCMAATIETISDDPFAPDPRCQCLAPRKRRAA